MNIESRGTNRPPNKRNAFEVVRRSVLQWRFIDDIAAKIDDGALRQA
jgi:hypothetical protein